MSKLAIIGSGATGYVSAMTAREAAKDARIDVFHGGLSARPHRLMQVDQQRWTAGDYAALHKEVRREVGLKFPPPKSHFGEVVPRHAAPPRAAIWKSRSDGGLTRYWSASLFPFTDAELDEWGFDPSELKAGYEWVARNVGIAATDDGLNRYFGPSYATLPPLVPTQLVERLVTGVERNAASGGAAAIAGLNRVAIETRNDNANGCIRCGGCFYGCVRESVFDASAAIRRAEDSLSLQHVHERVLRVKRSTRGLVLETQNGEHGPYDKIICAAGCVGTTELVARSFAEPGASLEFTDNELFVLPLFYLGRGTRRDAEYIAIANAIVGLLPEARGDRYAEAHVSPVPDLLTRFYLPASLDWPAKAGASVLRRRILLAKLYLHSNTAPRYRVVPKGDDLQIELVSAGRGAERLPALLDRLRRVLRGTGFWLPRAWPAMRSATSSHYAGGLGPGTPHQADRVTGEVEKNFHVVDSSLMPFSPAQPLTFTSMANARRIVQAVMHG